MSFETDRAALIHFLKFLEQKEVEMAAYENLFGPLAKAFPEQKLRDKYLALCTPPMGTAVRSRYVGLRERCSAAEDPASLLALLVQWLESRKS